MYIKRFTDSDNNEFPEEEENLQSESLSGFPDDDDDDPSAVNDDDSVDPEPHHSYPDENNSDNASDEKNMKYQKMMEEFRAKESKKKEEKQWNDFCVVKVEDIDRSDPEIDDYVTNVLVPGLIDFTKSKKYRDSLIRLFHDLGCSASFVFALAGVFHDVAHALQMAVESFEDKIIMLHQDDVAKAERIIVCYRKMFNKFDRSTIFAFNKEDKWRDHHEPMNFISFISPFKFQRTYERQI